MESASAPRDSRDLETERCKSLIQFNIKILFPLTEYEIEQLAKVGVRYCDGVTLECVFCRSKWEWIENEDVQNIIESHTHCEHPNRMETHQNNQTESVAVIVDNQVDELPMPNLPEIRRERRESDTVIRHLTKEKDQLRRANIELARKNDALTTENENLKSRLKCNICFSQKLCILLPCGHVCLCVTCSDKVNRKCPICRSNIKTVKNAFI